MSASAQEENLGDLVLRREIIRWLAALPDANLHVYVGAMPPTYVHALGLKSGVSYTDSKVWIKEVLRAGASGRAALVFSPGQQGLILRKLEAIHALVNVALALFVRFRGGVVAKVGRSLEGDSRLMLLGERVLVRLCNKCWVRDASSAGKLGERAKTMPDVAVVSKEASLAEVVNARGTRKYLAMSWRHDRPIPWDLIATSCNLARAEGLVPVLVTQVWKDSSTHIEIAQRMGIHVIDWADGDHERQLLKVTKTYHRCAVMLSNRLHSLVLAWNAGAVPIGYSAIDDKKIRTHMQSLGLRDYVVGGSEELGSALRDRLADPVRVQRIHAGAASEVNSVRRDLIDLLTSVKT